jgi:YqaJ-like recombinase protein
MLKYNCVQGDEEWQKLRLGRICASNMHKIISPTGIQSKQAEQFLSSLIAEIITGKSADEFKGNIHTERGKSLEEEAADYYAMVRGVELTKVGFCMTDDGIMGCSPDRFVGADGILEIKTCLPRIMVEYYEHKNPEQIEVEHRPQTQCGLYVNTDRKWTDTLLYSPGMKPIIVRSERQTAYLADMVRFTMEAHASLQTRIAALQNKGFMETPDDPTRLLRAG